jgi:ketosteroid isomerase-like protein
MLSSDDRLEILDLIIKADNAASDRDVATYVSMFTSDAVMDGEKGQFNGHDEIASAVGTVWASEGEGTKHLTLNTSIENTHDGATATVAHSTLVIVGSGRPPDIISVSAITHHVVKVEEGWRVARRTIDPA